MTAPLVAKLAPSVAAAPPNQNVWLRPCSEVKHFASDGNPSRRKFICFALAPVIKSFNWVSPVQGFNPVKFDGLSEENSVTTGNKKGDPLLTSLSNWLVWVNPCQDGQQELHCLG